MLACIQPELILLPLHTSHPQPPRVPLNQSSYLLVFSKVPTEGPPSATCAQIKEFVKCHPSSSSLTPPWHLASHPPCCQSPLHHQRLLICSSTPHHDLHYTSCHLHVLAHSTSAWMLLVEGGRKDSTRMFSPCSTHKYHKSSSPRTFSKQLLPSCVFTLQSPDILSWFESRPCLLFPIVLIASALSITFSSAISTARYAIKLSCDICVHCTSHQ